MGEELSPGFDGGGGVGEPVVPLIADRLHLEEAWRYVVGFGPGESVSDAVQRVFWVLVHDVLPSFAEPRTLSVYSESGQHTELRDLPESHGDRLRLFEQSMPDDPSGDIDMFLRFRLRTPSGHFALSENTRDALIIELEEDLTSLMVSLLMRGVMYRPPEPDASPDAVRQYGYNAVKLPLFLRSLQFALNPTAFFRDSHETGPDGYLEPGADQTGLPAP